MPSFKGRDLLLKVEEGEDLLTLGAARITAMALGNHPVDITAMDSDGYQQLQADAGVQTMELRLEGLFRDTTAEEILRDAAFSRILKYYRLQFPDGSALSGNFAVSEYRREGGFDGVETFSAVLLRSGFSPFEEEEE